MVTIQYRLGSFGYLFLDDDQAPGNVGVLDVKKAFEYVKNNIWAFGGDPDKITAAGQDSGANLALQIHSEKLFDKIILHSGKYTEAKFGKFPN